MSPARSPYVEEIGKHLRDVPWAERQALLDDVATHLNDAGLAPGELDPWVERFGTPEDYAHELRGELELKTDPASLRRARRVRLRTIRLRSKLLLGAAIVIAAAAIGGTVYNEAWYDRFEPFTFDNGVSTDNARETSVGTETEYVWRWRQGRKFAVGTWLHNNSHRSIRVTNIELTNADFSVPWDNWRITLGPATETGDFMSAPEQPVRPFTLNPGQQRLVWFRGNFVKCTKDYESTKPGRGHNQVTVGGAKVTFEARGRTLAREPDLGFSYGVTLGANYARACGNT